MNEKLRIEKEKILCDLQFNLESLIELMEDIKSDNMENTIINVGFTGFDNDKKNRIYKYITELKYSPMHKVEKEDQPLKNNQIINNDYLVESDIDLINKLKESKEKINWNNFKCKDIFYDENCNEYKVLEVYHITEYIKLG